MTAPAAATSTILRVRQARRALFRAVTVERSAVVLVREGEKVVRQAGRDLHLVAGTLGVLPAHQALTVENRPGPTGRYVASMIVPDPALVARLRRDGLPDGDPLAATRHDRTRAAFERAAGALEDPLMPPVLVRHAVAEVLLWLAEDGVGFGPDRPASLVQRLRAILAADPDTGWRAQDAARALAVSEATLRRRLAAEGTGFGDLLRDVRLTQALGLLQTTDLPVNRIALDCGYASPSRFAVRFRARFGMAPSHVRDAPIDRIGTGNDGVGTAAGPARP